MSTTRINKTLKPSNRAKIAKPDTGMGTYCREGNESLCSPVDGGPTVVELYRKQGDRYYENRATKPDAFWQALACYDAADRIEQANQKSFKK